MSDNLMPIFSDDGHVDEGTIHTWLDGAFDAAAASVVQTHVDACATCRAAVAEARGFIAGASRLTRALDVVPSKIVPSDDVTRVASRIVAAAAPVSAMAAAPATPRSPRPWYMQPMLRAAAALLVVVGGTTLVLRGGGVSTVAVVGEPVMDRADRVAPAASTSGTSAPAPSQVAEPSRPKSAARAKQDKRAVPTPTASPSAPPPSIASVPVTDVTRDATVEPKKNESAEKSGARPTVMNAVAALKADSRRDEVGSRDSSAVVIGRVLGGGNRPLRDALGANAATIQCWTLRSESPTGPQRIPVHLETPDLQSTKGLLVRLIGWPDSASRTSASAAIDANGEFSLVRVSGDRAVRLTLRRSGIEWRGSAMLAERATRNTFAVTLTPVNGAVCKP